MKNLNFLSLCLIFAISAFSNAYGPTWEELYQISWPIDVPVVYANDLYYMNNQYYNATNHSVVMANQQANCSSTSTFSPNFTLYCVARSVVGSNYIYSINLMDIYLNNVQKSFPIPGAYNDTPYTYLFYSEQYVIVILYDLDPYIYHVFLFDSEKQEFVCNNIKLPDVVDEIQSVWFTGTDFIAIFLDEHKNSDFLNINFFKPGLIYFGPSELQQLDFYGFNQSKIYLNYYVFEINGETSNEIQVCDMNSLGTFSFGERKNITTFAQINDTHLLISHYPGGVFQIAIYVITPELTFQQVYSYTPNLIAQSVYIYPLIGTSLVTVYVRSGTMIFDYDLDQIVSGNSIASPIFLGNGSVVNVTYYGYLIQSPGEPIYFVNGPFGSGLTQSPSNPNLYYAFYVPIYTTNLYPNCMLVTIDSENSNITQLSLPNCPGSSLSMPILKDVSYDEQGNPHILYRDALNMVYIATTKSVKGPFKSTILLTFPAFSQNLTSNIGYYVGVQATQTQLISAIFSLTDGTVIKSTTISGGTFNYVYKLNTQYFMIASSYGNSSTFVVWDAYNMITVSNITTQYKLSLQLFVPFYVLGTTAITPEYEGILVYGLNCCIFLINTDGDYSIVSMSGQHSYLDSQIVTGNTFFTYASSQNLYVQTLVNITSWDSDHDIQALDM